MNRRLYRSPSDRVLAGVAGGMAETYEMDPAVVRIAWALLILLSGGLLLILYIVIALVVPLRPEGEPLAYSAFMGGPDMPTQTGDPGAPGTPGGPGAPGPAGPAAAPGAPYQPPPGGSPGQWRSRAANDHRANEGAGPIVFGAILILVGGYFLLRQFIPALNPALFWPVLVIIGGVLLIAVAVGRRK
jgi:phage shock protein C